MKIIIEVMQIEEEYILSKYFSLDSNYYHIEAFSRFFTRLDDLVLGKNIHGVAMLPEEKSKRFTLHLSMDENGEYKIKEAKERVSKTNDEIITDVADFYKVKREDLFNKSRKQGILKPRQFSVFLMWLVNKLSLQQAASMFLQDHATALHTIRNTIPAYFISNDPSTLMAIEYFSMLYDIDLRSYILTIINKKKV